jgi:hypothetical protein
MYLETKPSVIVWKHNLLIYFANIIYSYILQTEPTDLVCKQNLLI